MKKGKRILAGVFILVLLTIGGACVYFYPTWKAAGILQEKMEAVHFSYEMEIVFDKGELPEAQIKMFQVLAELLGMEAEAYGFVVKGSVWEDRAHALVFWKDNAEPLVEFYMSGQEIALNEAMVYNAIRAHLLEKYGTLGHLIPEQKGNLYISLEQVEQMFGVKLEDICNMAFPGLDIEAVMPTRKKCFVMLTALHREKIEGGSRFELTTEQTRIRFDVTDLEQARTVVIQLDMQDPAGAFHEMERLLSKLGIRLTDSQLTLEQLHVLENFATTLGRLHVLESFTMTVAAGEGGEITMPTDYVNQDTVDLIAGIRALIQKISGGQSDAGSGSI